MGVHGSRLGVQPACAAAGAAAGAGDISRMSAADRRCSAWSRAGRAGGGGVTSAWPLFAAAAFARSLPPFVGEQAPAPSPRSVLRPSLRCFLFASRLSKSSSFAEISSRFASTSLAFLVLCACELSCVERLYDCFALLNASMALLSGSLSPALAADSLTSCADGYAMGTVECVAE